MQIPLLNKNKCIKNKYEYKKSDTNTQIRKCYTHISDITYKLENFIQIDHLSISSMNNRRNSKPINIVKRNCDRGGEGSRGRLTSWVTPDGKRE